MKAVLQRVASASVEVDGQEVSRIAAGLLILLAVEKGDGERELASMIRKTVELRIFPDGEGKMNRSALEVGSEALVVSQFTLAASVRRGRRPSFDRAARPEDAGRMVDQYCQGLRARGIPTRTGVFGAHMRVALCNDGPVTIVLDSADLLGGRAPEAAS